LRHEDILRATQLASYSYISMACDEGSVVFTDQGLCESERLFEKYFAVLIKGQNNPANF
jgi:hypothetical protein